MKPGSLVVPTIDYSELEPLYLFMGGAPNPDGVYTCISNIGRRLVIAESTPVNARTGRIVTFNTDFWRELQPPEEGTEIMENLVEESVCEIV